jgi:cobalamin biosynthesis Co2+ chelatase CbiK
MSTVLMRLHPGQVEEVIDMLKYINVDGETMEYIIEEVNMREQMLRQLIMSSPVKDTRELFEERISSIG